jgi:aminoglycoside 2'-N-acetyltransferase I
MSRLQVAHTADLDPAVLAAAHALLEEVFEDGFEEDDWEHALGGVHALVWDGEALVAHASVVQRRLLYDGRALRTGYVEAVGVLASRRGEGHAAAVMAPLERIIARSYHVGALGASDIGAGFYAARGWRQWQGRTYALTPDGIVRTEDEDGGVYVLPGSVPLDLSGDLACDWREGDVW